MSEDQNRRAASLQAARDKVAALPASHRAYLEGEFQRAENDAKRILRYPTATPTAVEGNE